MDPTVIPINHTSSHNLSQMYHNRFLAHDACNDANICTCRCVLPDRKFGCFCHTNTTAVNLHIVGPSILVIELPEMISRQVSVLPSSFYYRIPRQGPVGSTRFCSQLSCVFRRHSKRRRDNFHTRHDLFEIGRECIRLVVMTIR
jgi:hypothetical protein